MVHSPTDRSKRALTAPNALQKEVERIRKKITSGLKSKDPEDAQRNTALWLIDNLAIRAGNEKDTSEEADTVGCCSLRVEHITLGTDEVLVCLPALRACLRACVSACWLM